MNDQPKKRGAKRQRVILGGGMEAFFDSEVQAVLGRHRTPPPSADSWTQDRRAAWPIYVFNVVESVASMLNGVEDRKDFLRVYEAAPAFAAELLAAVTAARQRQPMSVKEKVALVAAREVLLPQVWGEPPEHRPMTWEEVATEMRERFNVDLAAPDSRTVAVGAAAALEASDRARTREGYKIEAERRRVFHRWAEAFEAYRRWRWGDSSPIPSPETPPTR